MLYAHPRVENSPSPKIRLDFLKFASAWDRYKSAYWARKCALAHGQSIRGILYWMRNIFFEINVLLTGCFLKNWYLHSGQAKCYRMMLISSSRMCLGQAFQMLIYVAKPAFLEVAWILSQNIFMMIWSSGNSYQFAERWSGRMNVGFLRMKRRIVQHIGDIRSRKWLMKSMSWCRFQKLSNAMFGGLRKLTQCVFRMNIKWNFLSNHHKSNSIFPTYEFFIRGFWKIICDWHRSGVGMTDSLDLLNAFFILIIQEFFMKNFRTQGFCSAPSQIGIFCWLDLSAKSRGHRRGRPVPSSKE